MQLRVGPKGVSATPPKKEEGSRMKLIITILLIITLVITYFGIYPSFTKYYLEFSQLERAVVFLLSPIFLATLLYGALFGLKSRY